jgi:hypothetical protein
MGARTSRTATHAGPAARTGGDQFLALVAGVGTTPGPDGIVPGPRS